MYKKIITILTLLTSLNGMSESITDKALDELTKVVKINNLIGKERKKVENNLTTFDELSANLPALYPNGFKGTERGSSCPAILLGEGDYRIKKNYRYYHSRDCMTVYVAPPKTVASIKEFESLSKYKNSCRYFNTDTNAIGKLAKKINEDRVYIRQLKKELDEIEKSKNINSKERSLLEKKINASLYNFDKLKKNKRHYNNKLTEYYHEFGVQIPFNLDFSVSDSDLSKLNLLNSDQLIIDESGLLVREKYNPKFKRLPVISEAIYRYKGSIKLKHYRSENQLIEFENERSPVLSLFIPGQDQTVDRRMSTVTTSIVNTQVSGLITLSKGGVCEYLKKGNNNFLKNTITILHKVNLFSAHAYVAEYDKIKLSGSLANYISKTSEPHNDSSQVDKDELFVADVMPNYMFSFYDVADNYIELIKSTRCDGYSVNKVDKNIDKICTIKDIMLTTQANMFKQYLSELEQAGKIEFLEARMVKHAVKAPYVIHIPTIYCRNNIFRKKCRSKLVAVLKYEKVQGGVTLEEYLNVGVNFKEDYGVTTPFIKTISTTYSRE